MELMHKEAITIGIVCLIVVLGLTIFIKRKTSEEYRSGTKAANTYKLRNTALYKKLTERYKILRIVLVASLIGSIVSCLVLAARPYRTDEVVNGVKKRDIILCLDVSYSLYDLNYEITDYLKGVVAGLKGDRIGVSIFNTSTVTYVPLTDDYDYVITKLDELSEYFTLQKEYMENYEDNPNFTYGNLTQEERDHYDEISYKLRYYNAGTLYNNMTRGSSLIGEGLGTALYSFPYLDDSERTRVIIMCTDNELNAMGPEIVNLKEASEACKRYKVTLFGIFPSEEKFYDPMSYNYASCLGEFKNAVENTGGKFYVRTADQSVSEIVQDIQKQKAMVVKTVMSSQTVDLPEIPFVILLICLALGSAAGLVLQK